MTQQSLEQFEEQLQQLQKLSEIGHLAGGIAHDFNNLLTVILCQAQLTLMQLDKSDPALRRRVEDIRKAGESAASLTEQLLRYTRKQSYNPQEVKLSEVVSNMSNLVGRLIGEDIELSIDTAHDTGVVLADPTQISQIVMNLAVNARDAMPHGGKLTIETAAVYLDSDYTGCHLPTRPGSYAMLTVTDNGFGIDADVQKRVFEAFFTTKEKGTGLGLSTVYGIVKEAGGTIWLYSEVGHGTTIKIYLPRVDDIEPKVKDKDDVASRTFNGKEIILLAEDDECVREITREVLEHHGYEIHEAEDGAAALALCESGLISQIDLLLTDVVMPRIGGHELTVRLREIRNELPVLYMSGYTETTIINHGILYTGKNFIQKPFQPEDIAAKVREVLDAAATNG